MGDVLRLADLCCKAGGTSYGYWLAGQDSLERGGPAIEVVGVDTEPQPRYPFEFIQADALEFPLDGFDLVTGSPPCKQHTVAKNIRRGYTKHPDIISQLRHRLVRWGSLWVIENVPGAPLIDPVQVCGLALDLNVKRHRWFEAPFSMGEIPPCPPGHPGDWVTVFGGGAPAVPDNRRRARAGQAREAMQIGWMTRDEMSQAVPPAYTRLIGRFLIDAWCARQGRLIDV